MIQGPDAPSPNAWERPQRRFDAVLLLLAILSLIVLALAVIGALSLARAGDWATVPLHDWYEKQYSVSGSWCCDVSDGHALSDDDWRDGTNGYEVRIEGLWRPVPQTAMRDPKGGPNPTGHPIVWYTGTGAAVTIYCFAPGWEG